MAPKSRAPCQVCNQVESKYTCSKCRAVYCSVSCYKNHKEATCNDTKPEVAPGRSEAGPVLEMQNPVVEFQVTKTDEQGLSSSQEAQTSESQTLGTEAARPPSSDEFPPPRALRPLTSVKWPYIPEESAYPDPLKRDDPKPLQMHQYEAIATSSVIRRVLGSNPNLPKLLQSIDSLQGPEREDALQRALGVSTADDLRGRNGPGGSAHVQVNGAAMDVEERDALRALAEAVESAVRGDNKGALGLDWGDES